MDLFNPFLIKKYKSLLVANPKSKVFCPLAQVYRLKKELKKAEEICLKGIQYNPSYAVGYILLAKIYKDQNQTSKALKALNKAKELSPDNHQIYQLLGEIYREEEDLEKTLAAFKMVSFIRPWDQTAKKTIQHLERALSQKHNWIKKSTDQEKGSQIQSPIKNDRKSQKIQKLQKLLSRIERLGINQDHEIN